MNRTAKKAVPAVAVLALLGTGWASAAALARGGNAAGATKASSPTSLAAAREEPTTSAPTVLPAASVPTSAPTTPPPSSPPTTVPTTVPTAALVAPATTAPAPPSSPPPVRPAAPAPKNCGVGQGTFRPASEAQFRTLMTGVWLLCQAPSYFGTAEAGMQVGAGGRWSKLERRPDGSLAPLLGWGNEGEWSTLDTSIMNGPNTYQLNLYIDGSGVSGTIPTFGQGSTSSGLTLFRLVDGSRVGDYVPAPAETRISTVPFPANPGLGCDAREEPLAPTTEVEFRTLMTRVWVLCGDRSVFGTNEDGLEIRADGQWFKLYDKDNGHGLVRGSAPTDYGTWDTIDASAMNGRPTFQINFYVPGGALGTLPAFGATRGDVSKVRLNNNGLYAADYVPASPGTTVSAA